MLSWSVREQSVPKSPEVRLSPKAQADIDAIFDYTDAQWGWRRAEEYLAELRLALASLTEPLSLAIPAKSIRKGYFVLRCGSHNVFFRKKPDAILIIRILHQRMDPKRHLR
jgi:toxin ParE1/3/4